MKKILCILLISGYCITVFAQQKDFKYELYFGAKGGMALSQVRFYPNVQTSYLDGNMGGLIFRMISEPHIGFQVEVNYIQKGWKEKPFTGQYASTTYFHQLNYVDIPIMTHVNLGKKAMRFILDLGPQISFLTSENQGFNPNNEGITSDVEGYKVYYGQKIDTPMDISFTVGIGMEYHLRGGSAISLESRFFYSLPNIFDSNKYTYKASQNNGVQATLAYLFQLKKHNKKTENINKKL